MNPLRFFRPGMFQPSEAMVRRAYLVLPWGVPIAVQCRQYQRDTCPNRREILLRNVTTIILCLGAFLTANTAVGKLLAKTGLIPNQNTRSLIALGCALVANYLAGDKAFTLAQTLSARFTRKSPTPFKINSGIETTACHPHGHDSRPVFGSAGRPLRSGRVTHRSVMYLRHSHNA